MAGPWERYQAQPQQPAGPWQKYAAAGEQSQQPAEQPESRSLFRRADDLVRGVADMATFGMADELSAWLASKTGIGGKEGDYEGNLAGQRERDAQGGPERLVGQLAGAVMIPGGFAKSTLGAAAEGAGLGAAYGFGSGEGGAEERAKNAGFGALAGGAAGGAIRGIANSLGNRAAAAIIPSNQELRKAANAAYNKAEAAGVIVKPSGMQRLQHDIVSDLTDFGYDPALQPGVAAVVSRLGDLSDKNVTLKGLDVLRRVAGNAAKIPGNPSQQALASKIIDRLDDFIGTLPDADVMTGNAKVGAQALRQARNLWGRLRKSEMVDTAALKAERRAASTGSGGNADNALRQNVRGLLDNPRTARGMTPQETAAAERVVRGTPVQNTLRLVGKAAPTGIVSGGIGSSMGAGAGSFVGGPVGAVVGSAAVPLVGKVAKSAADRMTVRNAEKLSQIIRSGGRTGKDLADLARGGQLSIPQVQRLDKFAKRIGIPVSEMAAMLEERVAGGGAPLEITVTKPMGQ